MSQAIKWFQIMLSKTRMLLSKLDNVTELESCSLANCPVCLNHTLFVSEKLEPDKLAKFWCSECGDKNSHKIYEKLDITWFDLFETKYDMTKGKKWLQQFRATLSTNIPIHEMSVKEANRIITRINLYG